MIFTFDFSSSTPPPHGPASIHQLPIAPQLVIGTCEPVFPLSVRMLAGSTCLTPANKLP